MIRSYSVDDITVIFDPGHDIHGEPLPVVPPGANYIKMKAYVDFKTHFVRDISGEQVVSQGIVYVIYSSKLNHKDMIYNINGDGIEYAILNIADVKDFSDNHQEVHLQ